MRQNTNILVYARIVALATTTVGMLTLPLVGCRSHTAGAPSPQATGVARAQFPGMPGAPGVPGASGSPLSGGDVSSLASAANAPNGGALGKLMVDGKRYKPKDPVTPAPPGAVSINYNTDPFWRYLVARPYPPVKPPQRIVTYYRIPPPVTIASRPQTTFTTDKKPLPNPFGRHAGWIYNTNGQAVAIFEAADGYTRAVRVGDTDNLGGRRVKAITESYLILEDSFTGEEERYPLEPSPQAPDSSPTSLPAWGG